MVAVLFVALTGCCDLLAVGCLVAGRLVLGVGLYNFCACCWVGVGCNMEGFTNKGACIIGLTKPVELIGLVCNVLVKSCMYCGNKLTPAN